jgi:hypothetical protein
VFPNWIGTDQRRGLQLDATRLTLSAGPLMLAGKDQMARLIWERADDEIAFASSVRSDDVPVASPLTVETWDE